MNIGLVAHDAKKKLMQNFCIAYRGILSKHNLYATETTGILVVFLRKNAIIVCKETSHKKPRRILK